MISRWIAVIFMFLLVNTVPFGVIIGVRRNRLPEVERLVEAQEYEKAIIELERINGISDVINVETDYYYSVCYNRLGMPRLASRYADYFLNSREEDRGIYEKAIAEFGLNHYQQALHYLTQIESGYRDDLEFIGYYGAAHYYNGDYEAAMFLLERAAAERTGGEALNYSLYDCYYETENYGRAVIQIDKDLAALNPEDEYYSYDREELIYYRGDYNYLNRQYEEAIKDYQILLDEDTYYMDEAFYLIARCYAGLEDYENTYSYLKQGLEYDSYYYDHYSSDEAFAKFFESEYYRGRKESFEPDYEAGLEAGARMEF